MLLLLTTHAAVFLLLGKRHHVFFPNASIAVMVILVQGSVLYAAEAWSVGAIVWPAVLATLTAATVVLSRWLSHSRA